MKLNLKKNLFLKSISQYSLSKTNIARDGQ